MGRRSKGEVARSGLPRPGSLVPKLWLGADLMAMQGIAQGKSVERRTGRVSRGNSFGLPAGLAVAALGVVFGDIGTSPLYTLKTCFDSANAAPTVENTLGILSLLVWALSFVVCLKYVTVLMRVDHDALRRHSPPLRKLNEDKEI